MELTGFAMWLNTVFASADEAAAIAVHRLYVIAGWFFTPFLSFISVLGKGGIFLIVLSIVLILFRKTRKAGCAMLLGLAMGALITNVCVKPLVMRPRPYSCTGSVYYDYWMLMGCHTESDFSFPSGHTTAAMDCCFALFLRENKQKWRWAVLLFPILMAVSRIYLSVHYFSDILGGFAVGIIGGAAGYGISLWIPERFNELEFFRRKSA